MKWWFEKSIYSQENDSNNDDAEKIEGEDADPLAEEEFDASTPRCAPNLSMEEYRQSIDEFEQILRS